MLPETGGGLAAFNWIGAGGPLPLMRSLPAGVTTPEPNALACYPLVPWSNRIGHGRFSFEGNTFQLAPNYPPEPYPIHGDGWLSALERGGERGSMRLRSGSISPQAHLSRTWPGLSYALQDGHACGRAVGRESRRGAHAIRPRPASRGSIARPACGCRPRPTGCGSPGPTCCRLPMACRRRMQVSSGSRRFRSGWSTTASRAGTVLRRSVGKTAEWTCTSSRLRPCRTTCCSVRRSSRCSVSSR